MALRVVSGSDDITDSIEGLSWSSVNPGGDETCTFTLKRSWFASSPEIERGNLLRVMDGVDELWRGRVEESDRSGESAEQIGVTAYGLGARLKDATMKEIYQTCDLSRWGPPPNARVVAAGKNIKMDAGSSEVRPAPTGRPVLRLSFSRVSQTAPVEGYVEVWFDANGISIGSIYYDETDFDQGSGGYATMPLPWFVGLYLSADETASSNDNTGNLIPASPTNGTLSASKAGRTFALWQLSYVGSTALDGDWRIEVRVCAVRGQHGLTLQGSAPGGYLVSQMIADAVGRARGVQLRRIDPTSFICEEAAFFDETMIESVVSELNKYEAHHRTWGTWGTDSPLDTSEEGYFDYRQIDTEPSWFILREQCDSCNLHSETATLYDTIHVRYTDGSGVTREVTRTADVPELNGIPRERTIDIGRATQAGAETRGDAELALSGGFAPARGSLVVSQPIRHLERGELPPHYMRANGAAVRVPDILSSPSLFALDSTPDRRTTFPIKRIAVNASDMAVPTVTAEVDQTNDAISALQARLELEAQLTNG